MHRNFPSPEPTTGNSLLDLLPLWLEGCGVPTGSLQVIEANNSRSCSFGGDSFTSVNGGS
ncbi:hypothetical protein [Sphingorhabdus lacus]|uniref:hypothetical protein n=1 Tax=Sphingorhabdus lacus TaxID=392610 RepID=UPI0035942C0E